MTNDLRARREAAVHAHIASESHHDVEGAIAAFHYATYDVVPLAGSATAGYTHPSPEAVRQHLTELMTAFPDLELIIVRLHHADEAVIVEGRTTGTHTGGPFAGLPPTGRRVDVRAAVFYRFEDDRMINETVYFDMATFMRQLGAEP